MILIDGTYAQASKQFKYLCKCNDSLSLGLTFVQLDMDEGGCESALSKIIDQPGKSKICTHQAAIMAIREVRDALALYRPRLTGKCMKGHPEPDEIRAGHPEPDEIRSGIIRDFEVWSLHLDSWLAYILSSKVKQGQKQVQYRYNYGT